MPAEGRGLCGHAATCTVLLLLSLTACANGPVQPSFSRAPQQLPWDDVVRRTEQAAASRGASPEQMAVITSGRVTFEEYEGAVRLTISCLRSNDIDVVGTEVTRRDGYPRILYSYAVSSPGRTDEQTDAVAQQCITRNSLFVEGLYSASPEVQAALDLAFESRRGSVVACLQQYGVQIPAAASRSDLEYYAADLLIKKGVSCMV